MKHNEKSLRTSLEHDFILLDLISELFWKGITEKKNIFVYKKNKLNYMVFMFSQ